jgi:hypothetical protein
MIHDPGQSTNVINQHPEVVEKIRQAHKDYWARVTPGDRDQPRFIVGDPKDPETFLTASDWYLPDVPWNHAQIAAGNPAVGSWYITVAHQGVYRFEVRRWPREARAPIRGIPTFKKTVDAWTASGGIKRLIYGTKMVPLPVRSIKLEVGGHSETKQVSADAERLVFDIELKQGDTQVKGTMLDQEGKVIAGTYYIYVTRL